MEEEKMMEEEANSWIRRTKFSHTVCHRLDSSRLTSIPFNVQTNRVSGLKSRPTPTPVEAPPANQKAKPSSYSKFRRHPLTYKQRSLSPNPQIALSDVFEEARSSQKRFSTPNPRRKEHDKGIMGKLFPKDSQVSKALNSSTSPLRHLASMKVNDKSKGRKESPWAKYFDHGGGRVTAVEAADEWSVDLSKLFLGLKFAHGAHSRLYHGIYNDEAVAVKIIRAPDDDESGALAARLEKQFRSEVTLLSRLHHQNVIKVIKILPSFFFH